MNEHLNIRMGISSVTNKDNFELYMEDLESVALDLTLWTPEVSAAPKQTRRPYNNPKYGVNAVDRAEQLCMNKRERGKANLVGKVRNVHLGMMVLQVISALMLTT